MQVWDNWEIEESEKEAVCSTEHTGCVKSSRTQRVLVFHWGIYVQMHVLTKILYNPGTTCILCFLISLNILYIVLQQIGCVCSSSVTFQRLREIIYFK